MQQVGHFAQENSDNPVSKEAFKMSLDDKLVIIFDIMSKVSTPEVEQNLLSLNQTSKSTEARVSVLGKSIDLEARNRCNNLIFQGIPELLRVENCAELIQTFLREKLGFRDEIYIQRAHRLRASARNKTRSIIACFRDNGVEAILSNAFKLRTKLRYQSCLST